MALQLSNEQLTVTFKDLGGELTSIMDSDGIEYLWQGDVTYWSGQAPLLFPICGSLRDNQVIYPENSAGLSLGNMPRHGLVRKQVFTGEQTAPDEVSYSLVSTDDMYQAFPYRFKVISKYKLENRMVTVSYQVTNLEKNHSMPFTLGGHPGFNCPLLSGENYEDYYLKFEYPETTTIPRVFPETGLVDLDDRQSFMENSQKLDLTYDLFKDDTLVLDRVKSKVVELRSKNHEKGIAFHLRDFPFLILWSSANKGPFIALEPWLGMSTSQNESDHFEEKINTQWLKPGESRSYTFSVEIL